MLVLLCTLVSQPSAAEDLEIECPEPAFPSRCYVVDMKPGDKAPMAGDLFSVDMATFMALQTKNVDERVRLAVAKTSSTARAGRERDAKVHKAELKAKDDQIGFLEENVERSFMEDHGWWVGFAAGAAVVIAIVAIVEHRPQPEDR